MRLKREQIASILLLTFVLGSQFAPLSHYLFMAISDAYPPFQESATHHQVEDEGISRHGEHGIQHTGTQHAGHHAPQPKSIDDQPEEGYLSPVHDHVYCEYADLFATFAATSPDVVSEMPVEFAEVVSLGQEEVFVSVISAHTQSRAPPVQL